MDDSYDRSFSYERCVGGKNRSISFAVSLLLLDGNYISDLTLAAFALALLIRHIAAIIRPNKMSPPNTAITMISTLIPYSR